jgi:glycosyltransferase involved in cell wall biosynthesis
MRYAWDQFGNYFGQERLGRLGHRAMRVAMAALARWDRATAGRVDRYLANSAYVAHRIRRYYNRRATVVYPPVDTGFFRPTVQPGTEAHPDPFFLIVSALVPYKRLDVAIEACRLMNAPLSIVGDGPDRARLAAIAGPQVTLHGSLPDVEVRSLYQRATAVLLPGEEDFGIVPVEAQACGRPVVAYARGGALETVVDGVTGVLVADPSVEALAEGLAAVRRLSFDPAALAAHADRFSRERFKRDIAAEIADTLTASARTRW